MATNIVPFSSHQALEAARAPVGFRQLPHNVEAEQALLGAILVNNDAYRQVCGFLQADHFYEAVHGRIYAWIKHMIEADVVADHVTIKDAFDQDPDLRDLDGSLYLARMARAAITVLNADDYAKVIVDCWLRRGIIAVCEGAVNLAYDGTQMTWGQEQLQTLRGDLDQLAKQVPSLEGAKPINDIVFSIIERLEKLDDTHDKPYYPTGIPCLDKATGGGLHSGEVYSFEARPESFKTGLLGTLAFNFLKAGLPTLYCCLEMGAPRIVERMIGAYASLNSREFRSADNPAKLITASTDFMLRLNGAGSWWHAQPGMSFDRLRAVVGDAFAEHHVKVIFVDYWQLVTGLRKGQNKVEHLESVAQWFEQFANARDVVIVTASQTNREEGGLWGDGLFRASTWMKRIHKVACTIPATLSSKEMKLEGLWLEHIKDRHGAKNDIGSELAPAMYISPHGPVAKNWGDW